MWSWVIVRLVQFENEINVIEFASQIIIQTKNDQIKQKIFLNLKGTNLFVKRKILVVGGLAAFFNHSYYQTINNQ